MARMTDIPDIITIVKDKINLTHKHIFTSIVCNNNAYNVPYKYRVEG